MHSHRQRKHQRRRMNTIRFFEMITLTRQDGKPWDICPSRIAEVDADGFGNGSWLTKKDGTKVHIKETVVEVRAKIKAVKA